MTLSRRWSGYLLGFAIFSWITWIIFIHNIAKDSRSFHHGTPQPFFIVHLVLTVLSVSLVTPVGWVGYRGLRSGARLG